MISILLVHTAATFFMIGVIWFVQIVHYPLFASVEGSAFARYELSHQRLTTYVVAPLMITESLTACLLTAMGDFSWQYVANLSLVALIWLSTFLVQVPLHTQLGSGFRSDVHRRLVFTNWFRTLVWSVRGVLVLAVVGQWMVQQ